MASICPNKKYLGRRKMEDDILITWLNDFIFCPVSIYFHMLYGETDRMSYQSQSQINGTAAHVAVDTGSYSTKKSILKGIDVYCEQYGLTGKIDLFDTEKGILTERKRSVKTLYDGYFFQVYAQCLALREAGYDVKKIRIYSILDNKNHEIPLPENNPEMFQKFIDTIDAMHSFRLEDYVQTCSEKCKNCIYEPACDRGIK